MTPLNISFDPRDTPGIIVAKMWVRDGSRADPTSQKGVHQLLGSLLTRGCGPYDHIQVSDLVEGCGAGLRCDTYEDGLLISLKCNDKDCLKLFSIMGWMIAEPHIEKDQLSLEKSLTIQNIKRQRESPFFIAFNEWRKLVYGNGPYGHDSLGIIEDIKKIHRREVANIGDLFTQKKKFLVISGQLPTGLKESLSHLEPFNSMILQTKSIDIENRVIKRINENQTLDSIVLKREETSQVILILGKMTIPHSHVDDIALRLLSCHLGSGMSSVLFKKLREDRGMAYEVGVYFPIRELESPFFIHASTTIDKSLITLDILKECWNTFLSQPMTTKEINLARAKFRGNIAHNSQSIAQRAERKVHLQGLKMNECHDKEMLKKIDSISSKEILEAARKHLQSPCLSLCGPSEAITKLERIGLN